ncbi:MAG TPA: DoxX family protein [Actinomycetota bacterium]|nr:DoxX family protein [Actinomycetota bacterium]
MQQEMELEEPRFAKWLFASPAAALIWLVVRVYLGYEWLHAGWEKVTGTSGGFWTWHFGYTPDSWFRTTAGLTGFTKYAMSGAAQGPHSAVNYGWYASFLNWLSHPGPAEVFAKVIPIGEMAVGICLILGLFTGIAAFFAGLLTMSFGLAGVAGVNPVFFIGEVFLILAWRNAGYYGLDRWVLPALGTPWHRGEVFEKHEQPAQHQLA